MSIFKARFLAKKKVSLYYLLLLPILVNLALIIGLLIPPKLEKLPYSNIVYDIDGQLLQASTAVDGQWRFPPTDSVPQRFKLALTTYEDKRFYQHPGFDIWAISRAFYNNLSSRKITSGGSTLTMQWVRIARNLYTKSVFTKLGQIFRAIHYELHFNKEDILKSYCVVAPFGSNVVGLETAAWRYFARPSHLLSWAETATLAVLPNAPGLIYPGRNEKYLRAKRDFLLRKLQAKNIITADELSVALLENLPQKPQILPQETPHLAQIVNTSEAKSFTRTTINGRLQKQVQNIANRHSQINAQNEIMNVAVLVADIQTGKVDCYVGNHTVPKLMANQGWVDNIQGVRSTGSLLKPLLYAALLDDSKVLPHSLVEDIPTNYNGYAPKNFSKTYDGALPASQVIARSLNVPSVRLLRKYSHQKFHRKLHSLGFHSINQSASYYGLSLILGGAEESLWNLCAVYAQQAHILQTFNETGKYPKQKVRPLILNQEEWKNEEKAAIEDLNRNSYELSAGALWYMFKSMNEVHRPEEEKGWEYFSSAQKIAYKTGTSFGYRDAWAIGLNGSQVVGVWVGNSTGEGRDGLIGVEKAAPIMFEVFKLLPKGNWFKTPYDDLQRVTICNSSGLRAGVYCEDTSKLQIPKSALYTPACAYHLSVHLDQKEEFRVNHQCHTEGETIQKNWFVLPPVMEWYFKQKNPWYKSLPPFRDDCEQAQTQQMKFIYPEDFAKIKIPIELDGQRGAAVFKLAHRTPEALIYWFLNENYLGQTQFEHEMKASPNSGKHTLKVIDSEGQTLQKEIMVLD